nr:DUF2062 domain-containing protein [uncultured Gellertiella sp.]
MLFRRRHKPGVGEKLKALFWPRKGFRRPFQYFGMRILRLNATPHAIAAGLAAGVAAAWTPFIGLHIVLSFGLAYLLAGNMLAAVLGTTAFGNPITYPFIWGLSWKLGNYLLGSAASLGAGGIDLHHLFHTLSISQLWRPFIAPMLLGAAPPAVISGIVSYIAVYFAARVFQARRRQRLSEVARNRVSNDGSGIITV